MNDNVKRLAVANGPNIFQMLLVHILSIPQISRKSTHDFSSYPANRRHRQTLVKALSSQRLAEVVLFPGSNPDGILQLYSYTSVFCTLLDDHESSMRLLLHTTQKRQINIQINIQQEMTVKVYKNANCYPKTVVYMDCRGCSWRRVTTLIASAFVMLIIKKNIYIFFV